MRLKKKVWAAKIIELLDTYIPHIEIPLHFTSPFEALIATLLSAQCTDLRVNKTTPILFAKANTPEAMIALTPQEIEEIIRPCGLAPKKSRAIHALSHLLIEQHHGRVPNTMQQLTALPGVGRKTASVILSQVFQEPAFPVDTHIHRCAHRWRLSQAKGTLAIEQDLCALFPKTLWSRLHLQIILYARAYCPARGHAVNRCPICFICQGKTGQKEHPVNPQSYCPL